MTTSQNNVSTNTDKLNTLSTISDLQQLEKQLFTNLEEIANYDDENSLVEKDQIIKQINDLSQTRINLFNTLNDLYQYEQENVNESRSDLVDKMVVAKVMESQLNNTKEMINELEQVKDNKLRMVQINTYYGKQYQYQTDLMKFIIKLCVAIIVVLYLTKLSFIPKFISNLIILIIIIFGGFLIFRKVSDLSSRDKMEFDRYQGPSMSGRLSGNYDYNKKYNLGLKTWSICGEGTAFDDSLGQCLPKTNSHVTPTVTSGATASVTPIVASVESFSIMNNGVVGFSSDIRHLSGPAEV